jgi:hypothetical protein
MEWACNSGGGNRNGENVLSEYLRGRSTGEIWLIRTVISRLMLKLQSREQSVRFWPGLFWLSIGFKSCIL